MGPSTSTRGSAALVHVRQCGKHQDILEDTFRDMRQMNKVAGQNASRFLRMQHVITSGSRRSADYTTRIVKVDQHDLGSVDVKKRSISQAVFAPPTNAEKAKHSLESGRPFDIGLPHVMPEWGHSGTHGRLILPHGILCATGFQEGEEGPPPKFQDHGHGHFCRAH